MLAALVSAGTTCICWQRCCLRLAWPSPARWPPPVPQTASPTVPAPHLLQVGVSPVCILGVNINRGQEISLRLRTDDLKGALAAGSRQQGQQGWRWR